MKWYDNKDDFARKLDEAGNVAQLSRNTGIPVTTLKDAKRRHGIVIGKPSVVSPDAELTKQNEVLRLENKKLRRHAIAATTGDVEAERVMQRLEVAIAEQRPDWSPRLLCQPERSPGRTPQEMLLLWSDLHAAEVVSLEETRGINEYSWDIMLDRMTATADAVFSHSGHLDFPIETLHIAMLGDMLSGDIHEELAITNDRPLAEAVVDLAYAHIPWLLRFAERFPKIMLSGVPGNHPRASKKPSAKMAHNNADWLFYKMIEALLRDHPQFEFSFPRGGFNVVTIAERWRALEMHGDGIRSTMPGVPWGGLSRRVTTLQGQFTAARQPLDFVMCGHFHSRNALDGVQTETYMNGSVKGPDEYSLKQFGSGRPASQTLMTFHPERGWTGTYAVALQDRLPGSEGW